jgi:hypothetical protein
LKVVISVEYEKFPILEMKMNAEVLSTMNGGERNTTNKRTNCCPSDFNPGLNLVICSFKENTRRKKMTGKIAVISA